MSVAVRRDFERLLLSLVIAILLHIVVFILFPLVINLSKRELPHYSGPIYVNIEEVPEVSKIRIKKSTVAISQTAKKQQGEKPVVKDRKDSTSEKTSVGTYGSNNEATISNEPNKLSVPGGEIKTEHIVSAEEASPLYVEKREINIPLAIEKKKVSQLPPPEKTKEPESLALGEGTYSNLDKLLKSSGEQTEGKKEVTETGKSQVISGEELSNKKGDLASNIQIQWENPSLSRKAIYTPDPVIPTWVSKQGLQLEVTVTFTLLPEGIVSTIKLLRSSGFSDVDSAVIETIRRWRFQPIASTKNVLGRITYVIKPNR